MVAQGRHALIFGASGISGWSLMKQCLSYPSHSTFAHITGLCNRPADKHSLLLPDDPRLSIVSGIDLTGPHETVVSELKKRVPGVEEVDTVFFCGIFLSFFHFSFFLLLPSCPVLPDPYCLPELTRTQHTSRQTTTPPCAKSILRSWKLPCKL